MSESTDCTKQRYEKQYSKEASELLNKPPTIENSSFQSQFNFGQGVLVPWSLTTFIDTYNRNTQQKNLYP